MTLLTRYGRTRFEPMLVDLSGATSTDGVPGTTLEYGMVGVEPTNVTSMGAVDLYASEVEEWKSGFDAVINTDDGDIVIFVGSKSLRDDPDVFRQGRLFRSVPYFHELDSRENYTRKFSERFDRRPRAALGELSFDLTCIRTPDEATAPDTPQVSEEATAPDTPQVSEKELPELLFPLLEGAPLEVRDSLMRLLIRHADPKSVLDVALRLNELYGSEAILLSAAGVLECLRERAWPVLKNLAMAQHPQSELFVHSIAYLERVPVSERVKALEALARHSDVDVRRRVLEVLPDLDDAFVSVWQILLDDIDEGIREEAIGFLEDGN